MKRGVITGVGVLISIVIIVALLNYIFLQSPISNVIDSDPRNKGIVVFTHYKYFLVPNSLIFDLRQVSGETSPADVTRVLLQYAKSIKSSVFNDITLSYKGNPKFLLKGDFFHTLGEEFGTQNPIYTIRTFPENVFKLDGTAAFGTWTGGWLGVVGKQMEDFNEFHKQWYIADIAQSGN